MASMHATLVIGDMRNHLSTQFTLLLLMSMLLIGISLPLSTHAQSSGWSRPTEISSTFGGWFPDIIADRFGRVHVVWAGTLTKENSDVFDVVMYRSRDERSDWTEPVDIVSLKETNGESYATRPVLMVDQEDQFHLSYRNSSGVLYTKSSSPQLGLGASWATPQVVTSYGYFSEVVEDRAGTLHLIYTENVPTSDCANCFHVFHRSSVNHGMSWSLPYDVSKLPTGSAKPSIVVDVDNRLHIAWEAGFGGDLGQLNGPASIMYSRFDSSMARWSEPLALSHADTDSRNVALQLDRNGRLIVVYLTVEDNSISFRRSSNSGVTWSAPVPIPGLRGSYVTPLDRMDMAMDSSGGD